MNNLIKLHVSEFSSRSWWIVMNEERFRENGIRRVVFADLLVGVSVHLYLIGEELHLLHQVVRRSLRVSIFDLCYERTGRAAFTAWLLRYFNRLLLLLRPALLSHGDPLPEEWVLWWLSHAYALRRFIPVVLRRNSIFLMHIIFLYIWTHIPLFLLMILFSLVIKW